MPGAPLRYPFSVTLKLTGQQLATLQRLGGAAFLRGCLDAMEEPARLIEARQVKALEEYAQKRALDPLPDPPPVVLKPYQPKRPRGRPRKTEKPPEILPGE